MKLVYGTIRPVDILAISVHPDDVELTSSGTIIKHRKLGNTCAIVDLTQGELGSRGSAFERIEESRAAAQIMDLTARVNLQMRDGFFTHDERHIVRIAEMIRRFQPKIILANSVKDRHPDHGRAAQLIAEANFYAGLIKIQINDLPPHRATSMYHYIQDKHIVPDICVDVTPYLDQKLASIKAYKTQFLADPEEAIQTPISSQDFLDFIVAKMRVFGRPIGVTYAEGFTVSRPIGVNTLLDLS